MSADVILWNMVGVGLIISESTGVTYKNQTCGHACMQSEMEGIFVPFNNDPPLDDPEQATVSRLDAACRNAHYLDNDVADRIDAVLSSSPQTASARVDRTRLGDSHEAWIYVDIEAKHDGFSLLLGFGKCRGVLTWPNSD